MGMETPERNESVSLYETAHETASWAGEGNKVFVTVTENESPNGDAEKFVLMANVEDEAAFAAVIDNQDEWIGQAPTVKYAETEEAAKALADQMLADREKWLGPDYN